MFLVNNEFYKKKNKKEKKNKTVVLDGPFAAIHLKLNLKK
jgi:hypothetical protein